MSSKLKPLRITRQGLEMRSQFHFSKFNLTKWFPGHMAKGIAGVQSRLTSVDCIVEVSDARIPISGRNNDIIKSASTIKPHILILNKFDLITTAERKKIAQYYKKNSESNLLFTNCKNHTDKAIQEIVPLVIQMTKTSERFNRTESKDYGVMVLGIPNVGKSSIINALRALNLRKRKGTRVGPDPGVTKHVLEKIKICLDPLIYIHDTPGILAPKIGSIETALKLALCNTIKNRLIGEELIADYLLYRMNERGNHNYVDAMKLDKPTDDIKELLRVSAVRNNYMHRVKNFEDSGYLDVPDMRRCAEQFLLLFHKGLLGSLDLDNIMYK